MIRSSLLRTSSAAALVGLLALTGCSSDKAAGTAAGAEEGPLSKILSSAWGDYDEDENNRQQAEIENLVAECMVAEGFEYIPMDYSSMGGGMVTSVDMEDMNTEEWIATNGYGMTVQFPDETADEDLSEDDPGMEFVDPNEDYIASLSETQQSAFYAALSGTMFDDMSEEDWENYVYSWEDNGCQGAAQHKVTGGAEDVYNDPKFTDLMEEIDDFYLAAGKDPRITEISAEWAGCMADSGYPDFASPEDAMMSVSEAQNELYSFTGEDPEEYIEPSAEALAKVRELEIATALADFKCKQKVDLDNKTAAINLELEEAFVKDHKAALDEFVTAMQESRK